MWPLAALTPDSHADARELSCALALFFRIRTLTWAYLSPPMLAVAWESGRVKLRVKSTLQAQMNAY